MSNYELYNVLLQWLQTFELDEPTSDDITDGVQIAQVLHKIAPEWFSKNWLAKIKLEVGENWRLKVSNMKKIIEGVTDYYQEYINPNLNFVKPDGVRIGEQKDASELVKLLQLILGCAVNCNKKQDHIEKIMQMEESAQNVIMQSIQELENLLGSAPLSLGSNLNIKHGTEMEQMMSELQMTVADRDQMRRKCLELEVQLSALQEERNFLQEDKKRLEDRLLESSTDTTRDNAVRKQIDLLKGEIFKLETSRDDYRMKLEMQEKEMMELQAKFDSLQQTAAEARHLKDEVDILREDADKVEKLETTVKLYKKKLEELSELKREMKLLEDKNLNYVQQTLELEEELKKANAWKTQAEMYKKQTLELRNSLTEETKKIDKLEFENCKMQEKLNAIQKEKERLVKERDALKENNEELLCDKLQLKEDTAELTDVEGKLNVVPEDVSVIDLKREVIKLRHENSLLKINRKQSEDEKISLMQAMYDDVSQQNKQLVVDCRLANQRILQLEAELKEKELNDTKTVHNNLAIKDMQNQLQLEKGLRLSESAEKDRLLLELKHVKQTLFEALSHKEQEYEELEDKYRKCLEKARTVAKSLNFPELLSISEEINSLSHHKISEKENVLLEVEKQLKQNKSSRDSEEKLLATAFYHLAQKKQQESMDQRLMTVASSTGNLPFLAKHRQSAFRRNPFAYSSK